MRNKKNLMRIIFESIELLHSYLQIMQQYGACICNVRLNTGHLAPFGIFLGIAA